MPTKDQTNGSFTPALGRGPTKLYDAALRLFTRERRWRGVVIDAVAAANPATILDVGCGTGTLAIALANRLPGALITGIDPDPEALGIARSKAQQVRHRTSWRRGFASDAALEGRADAFDMVTCTLVLHQVPLASKAAGLVGMHAALRPAGWLVLADYSEQRSWFMRTLFGLIVQRLDGREDTQPNADGVLPQMIVDAGFVDLHERQIVLTPSGSISVLVARRPG